MLTRLVSLIVFLMLLTSSTVHATGISFSTTDLPDVVVGENLYRYNYSISEFSHPAGFGFSVLFSPTLYTLLQSPPPSVGPDWDIISLQPDTGLPDDGLYDALALVESPSPLSGFSVEFVWLGSGTPGSQPFVLYDQSFSIIETGQTTAIPEPSVATLLALSLVALAFRTRTDHRRIYPSEET